MNVLMVGYFFYESDNRVRRYAEVLAKTGYNVDVVGLQSDNAPVHHLMNGVNVYNIQSRKVNEQSKFDYLFRILLFLLKSFLFITKNYFKKKYCLIHVHSVPDFEVFSALIPKLLGTKVILDIHDIVPELYSDKFHTGKSTILFKMLVVIERLCCSFADHVIISNHIWYTRIIDRSVNKKKCSVILNYPDPTIFFRKRKKQLQKEFILLYPGTVSYHQGLDIAVQAMAKVVKQDTMIQLHIYGKGPAYKDIKALVDKLELNKNVKMFNHLSLEGIVEKMTDADIGLVPKRDNGFGGEAFSTKTFEFMQMEVPVLISKTRIDQYYFNENVVSFFRSNDPQDLSEKILYLSRHKDVLRDQVKQAKTFIRANQWDVKKDEYFDIIDKIIVNS